MLVKDVVKRINKELATITKHPETLNPIHSKNVDLASQRFVQEMRDLLAIYAQSDIDANEQTLSPLFKQLEKYANFVLDTNAIFAHNSRTHANQLYLFIAFELSELTNIHPLKLFYPSLAINSKNAHTYNDIALDRALMSDDNHTLIDVVDAYIMGRNKKGWKHTHPTNGIYDLSDNEKYRLEHFTNKTVRYFQDIEKNDVSERRLNKAKNDMLKSMHHSHVRASYGELGEARLAVRLYPNRNKLSRKDVFDLLSAYPASMRGKYLAGFDAKTKELEKIVLQSSKLTHELSNPDHYKGNLKYNTAVLFTFLELYLRDLRARNSDFNSFLGWATGRGIAKSYKDTAATILYKLMENNVPLEQLRSKALEVFSNDKTIPEKDKPFLLRSLDQGVLGQWVAEAERIGSPKKEVSNWFRRS